MGSRGKMNVTELTVVQNVQRMPRPEPPRQLTEEQKGIWRSLVQSMPADWVKTHAEPLLIQLCIHTVEAKRIANWIENALADPDLDLKQYDRLLKMQERESRAIASLSVKLRFSPSTEYRKETKRETEGRPWAVRQPSRNSDKVD